MITPAIRSFENKGIFDSHEIQRKGNDYYEKSGMKRMSQLKNKYPCYSLDFQMYQKNQEVICNELNSFDALQSKSQLCDGQLSDGNETMEEDDVGEPNASLANFKLNNLFKRKRKDKTLKCSRCGRGGHPEAACMVKNLTKHWCHVCCQFKDKDHDTLDCEVLDYQC